MEWIERQLKNGDVFHIKEYVIDGKLNEKKSSNNTIIHVRKIRQEKSSVVVFLTNNDDLIGYVECKIFENNQAELNVSEFMNIILDKQFGIIWNGAPAINTRMHYRRRHKATILLIILFEYLKTKGIKTVNVDGINESAINFYLSNGAEMIDDKKGVFEDINLLLPNLYEKVGNQIDKNDSKILNKI